MYFLHLALASALVVPGMVATGIYVMPSEADKIAANLKITKAAAVERQVVEEQPQQILLQPFYVFEGVFVVQLEARGENGRSALCGNLPLLHDAVVGELYRNARDSATDGQDPDLKLYAKNLVTTINEVFGEQFVNRVELSFADRKNFGNPSKTNPQLKPISSQARCATPKA